ncbi:hypothetical protein MCW82_27975 [Azospirillum doebereinerae]|uniref:hypothetical protein n=1 Tax=Azospirillum doebereinerae TaxID=92933 RepID=UPI001EE54ABF|nr:hypothetical protein [Azospirillum doebereinerae]MCG5243623.1 hypothetical protein [Azospirillum doebereinerae]
MHGAKDTVDAQLQAIAGRFDNKKNFPVSWDWLKTNLGVDKPKRLPPLPKLNFAKGHIHAAEQLYIVAVSWTIKGVTLPGVFVVYQVSGQATRAPREDTAGEWRVYLALRVRLPFAVTDIPAVGAIAHGLFGINGLSVLITTAELDEGEAFDLSEQSRPNSKAATIPGSDHPQTGWTVGRRSVASSR